ncbi:hypothetical protein E5288_WYG022063 [Bos mutus]|uniref:Wnt inhibitory factor 1 n=1 Tax=Bos mutus TaxID=72004 RepID=A0A6B0RV10_9CETA|nr:hypothetical protein [Bos mutus]
MARKSAFPAGALWLWSILPCLLVLRAEVGQQPEESLYLWIDAHQARVLIVVDSSCGLCWPMLAPQFSLLQIGYHRSCLLPYGSISANSSDDGKGFKAEYFYEFLSLRSLDKGIMADPTVNVPLLGTVPHKASVVQVGFPCLGKQDGVAAFEVNVIVMNSEGNTILQTPQNAIFFKTCQQGKCPQPCRNGGKCIGKNKCKCSKGYQGDLCSKRYGASLLHTLRPAGAQLRQHTPSVKKAEERQDPPESNYIW